MTIIFSILSATLTVLSIALSYIRHSDENYRDYREFMGIFLLALVALLVLIWIKHGELLFAIALSVAVLMSQVLIYIYDRQTAPNATPVNTHHARLVGSLAVICGFIAAASAAVGV